LKKIKNVIALINLNETNLKYKVGGFDFRDVELKIFNKEKEYHFKDYGMESSFTLVAIYKLIQSLNPILKISFF
jgi:hypothetical protein